MAVGRRIDFVIRQFGDSGTRMETMKIVGAGYPPCPKSNRLLRAGTVTRPYIFIFVFMASLYPVHASQSQLKEGNRLFKNGHYDQALKLYEDALIDTPYSSILNFNAGDA